MVCLCVVPLSTCQRATEPTEIDTAVNSILQGFAGDPSVGIIVEDLTARKVLYQLHPQRSFTPGSTTKVLTATAALTYLGANYHFSTSLSSPAGVKAHVLEGNLYLDFSGDPSLTIGDLKHLLATLKQRQVQTIQGDIVITTKNIAPYQPGPGFMWDDQQFAFAAPSSAVVLNQNRFTFRLYSPSQLELSPYIVSQHSLKRTPVQVSATSELKDDADCSLDMHSTAKNQYTIVGCMPYSQPYYDFAVAVQNPHYLLRQVLQQWLHKHHVQLQGSIRSGTLPPNSVTFALHESKPLSHLIKHMLVTSDNLYANLIFKTLGAIYEDGPGTWSNGQKAVLSILQSLGIDTRAINLADGAGLSRYNHFAPQTLADVINYNATHPDIGQYFFNSLAVSGKSGTFKHFLLGPYTGDFHGKTGSMTYVASVAGILTNQPHRKAVIIMINGAQNTEIYFSLIHDIIYRLAQISES